jgi:hypothetical protein
MLKHADKTHIVLRPLHENLVAQSLVHIDLCRAVGWRVELHTKTRGVWVEKLVRSETVEGFHVLGSWLLVFVASLLLIIVMRLGDDQE